MDVKSYFSDLKSTLETRNSAITRALEHYKVEAARIRARYSEAVAADELGKLEAATRSQIEDADKTAHDAAERTVERLRKVLSDHIGGDVDTGLLAKLQAAQTFGLKLTRSEVEALAEKAGGDPVALACLAQVAEKGGYQLDFTTVETLERDLKTISSMFRDPSHYTPDGLFSEGMRCHPDRMYQGINYGRPDATYLSMQMKPNKDAPGKLDEMSDRWSNADIVELKAAPVTV